MFSFKTASKKELEKGDKVYLNDQVFTESGGSVVIKTANNQVMELGSQQQLTLTNSMLSGQDDESEDDLSLDELQAAIAEGADPIEVAQAAAAGEEQGSSGEGSSEVVEVQRNSLDMPVIEREDDYEFRQQQTDVSSEAGATESSATANVAEEESDEEDGETEDSVTTSYKPVAQTSSMVTNEDVTVLKGQLYSLDNNSDETMTYTLVSAPEAGSISINADGSFEFNPASDFEYLAEGESKTVT
ncbi:hypothetical protein GZ77_24840 [Endozoicomonas montiporae]|uniref:Retention module-containing protein n=2 Tax=Endozoicomonas montiporae TaxID=1027273 RepID=A0A081MZW0_9GAMM|nr:retention module-containing protein [Endozoicomonas montiporae]AMO54574.1 hypothetical protein EZMO1_0314 [Endozoicomonas montiporae CL-33]KEQ11733.1 hypothetical protein GZ77_24840 [Endozoicomonas montiporae]